MTIDKEREDDEGYEVSTRIFKKLPNYMIHKDIVVNDDHLKDRDEMLDDLRNMNDMVNHPPHYISENGLEVIDVIGAFTANLYGLEAVCTGNVLKYMCRWRAKNGQEDLKKAKWYLEKLISIVEDGE